MRRSTTPLIGLLCAAAFAVSCQDDSRNRAPTSPTRSGSSSADAVPGQCGANLNLPALINTVFGAGSANAISAQSQLANVNALVSAGNIPAAQAAAKALTAFILAKVQEGGLPGTPKQVQILIAAIDCQTGITSTLSDAVVVYPSDAPQIVESSDNHSGVFIPPNTNDQPIVITFTTLPTETSPLITKLDQYPSFVSLTETGPLNNPVVVAVCPSSDVPLDVLARLRLGHQATGGFEITPPADGSFLDCSLSTAQSHVPAWLRSLASLVLPKPLYAKVRSGGVGGTATEFSPFGAVDPQLRSSAGVGGTATEFRRIPAVPSLPGARSATVVGGVCTAIDAPIGMGVETACRPEITLTTFRGTVMQNVPVGWAIDLGGGSAAPETRLTQTCGTFGATAATTTDLVGKAAVCWNLGPTPGTNTVIATPTAGGDAPPGVTFDPPRTTFTGTATRLATTSTVSCPASVTYTGSPVTPCSGGVTGPGLSLALTPTYTSNLVGTATAAVNYAGDATHLPSSASTTFQIFYLQTLCFGAPISKTMPLPGAGLSKGANISVNCQMRKADHSGAPGASGDLLVQDKGLNGLAAPVTVLSVPNAFTPGVTVNYLYSYILNPLAAGLVSGHYYLVTASWNDGSTSVGWFSIR